MIKTDKTVEWIVREAEKSANVPVVHAPATSVGEKIIYRCTPGKYDGDFERFTVTMRFISKDVGVAAQRAMSVSRRLAMPGDKAVWTIDGLPEFIIREEGGGSGYIGRTGYYFVLTKFSVRRRLPSSIKEAIGNFEF